MFKFFIISSLVSAVIGLLGGFQNMLPPLTGIGAEESARIPKGKSIMDMKQSADPEDCRVIRKPQMVTLDKSEYPLTSAHVVQARQKGEVRVMHLDREGADHNRELSLAGIPTRPELDRDEYPMAVSMEGGRGADIKYVPYADNRGAGSSVGSQLSEYCSGQAFFIKIVP